MLYYFFVSGRFGHILFCADKKQASLCISCDFNSGYL